MLMESTPHCAYRKMNHFCPCCILEQDTFNTSQKVLVIPRKRRLRPGMTEKLLTGTLNLNKTKPNVLSCLRLSYHTLEKDIIKSIFIRLNDEYVDRGIILLTKTVDKNNAPVISQEALCLIRVASHQRKTMKTSLRPGKSKDVVRTWSK